MDKKPDIKKADGNKPSSNRQPDNRPGSGKPNGNKQPDNKQQMNNRMRIIYAVLLVAFLVVASFSFMNMGTTTVTALPTNEFVAAVNNGCVSEVTYGVSAGTISGKYWPVDVEHTDENLVDFTSTYVGDDSINKLMADHPEITYNTDVSSSSIWATILSTVLPLLLFGVLIWFFMSQMNVANKQQMSFGKTKSDKAIEERPDVRFSDVAGIDEAVEELKEVRDFLADPTKFEQMGATIPHGVLLVGPPGTGKTLLAKAVAGEAGVPFFAISGSDFVEMFVGVGASRVRDLFESAKKAAPSIIFIDEIDAVGRQRGAGLGGGHDEREQTLNQLLVEMDGFEKHESVILIAATNRVDVLDPALLRPGRFDRQVVVDRPDLKGREQILRVHAKGKPMARNVDLSSLAKLTTGFTGADLANLLNEAALLAARRDRVSITNSELDEAMERVIAGPERKSRVITDKEKRTIAYHESGHALVGHNLDNADPVHKISIIARGQALGYTLSLPTEDRFLQTRNEMLDDLAMFLGGRVSEEVACDDITTGASNDLERATKMAKQMVTRYGMTEALGNQVYGEASQNPFLGRDYSATPDYSEATAQRIDEEVAVIMRKAHDIAKQILEDHREQLDLMAKVLLERETVEGPAVEALLDNKWDDYLAHEDEYKAKQAEEEKQQAEEDKERIAKAREEAEKVRAEAEEKAADEFSLFPPFTTEEESRSPKPPESFTKKMDDFIFNDHDQESKKPVDAHVEPAGKHDDKTDKPSKPRKLSVHRRGSDNADAAEAQSDDGEKPVEAQGAEGTKDESADVDTAAGFVNGNESAEAPSHGTADGKNVDNGDSSVENTADGKAAEDAEAADKAQDDDDAKGKGTSAGSDTDGASSERK